MLLRAITLAALSVLVLGCQGDKSPNPPIHPNWNMDNVTRFDPQEKNAFFADLRAQRPLVEGTVSRGNLKADDHLYRGKDASGEWVETLPASRERGGDFTDSLAVQARGEQRYNIYCTPCHNDSGHGRGIVVERALELKDGDIGALGFTHPPDFRIDRLKSMPVGYFYNVITNGWGGMMPYKSQIHVDDRWAIAAYVKNMQDTPIPEDSPEFNWAKK